LHKNSLLLVISPLTNLQPTQPTVHPSCPFKYLDSLALSDNQQMGKGAAGGKNEAWCFYLCPEFPFLYQKLFLLWLQDWPTKQAIRTKVLVTKCCFPLETVNNESLQFHASSSCIKRNPC